MANPLVSRRRRSEWPQGGRASWPIPSTLGRPWLKCSAWPEVERSRAGRQSSCTQGEHRLYSRMGLLADGDSLGSLRREETCQLIPGQIVQPFLEAHQRLGVHSAVVQEAPAQSFALSGFPRFPQE